MANTCSGPNCDRTRLATKEPPLCKAHYYQRRRGTELSDLTLPFQRDLTCSFPECERPARARNLCKLHYDHSRVYGEPRPIGSITGKRSHRCHEPGCPTRTTYKFCEEHRQTAGSECAELTCRERAINSGPYCVTHAKKDRMLRHFYNISLRQRDQLIVAQDCRCAICQERKELHVDHCHDTGAVRGMLCGNCNRAIGLMKDNPIALMRASKYLAGD